MRKITSQVVSFAGALMLAALPSTLQATPYASGVSNNLSGTVSFYINESGASVVVTFEDGSTNVNFNGITTGVNVTSGLYSFTLGAHTTYAITVTKQGTGAGMENNFIQNTNWSVYTTNLVLQGFGDPRGVAVNANPSSPYFGRIYVSRGGTAAAQTRIYDMNPDGSWSTAGVSGSEIGSTTWSTEAHSCSPFKISVAPNDDVMVGDWSTANAGVFLSDPNLTTNEVVLGPVGSANGTGAGVHSGVNGRPVLIGDLNSGATLYTVDSDFPTAQPGSILVYSNLTWTALSGGTGWQTAPDTVGAQVTLNYNQTIGQGFYFYPSLAVGPSGYIYSGEYRSGVSAGDTAGVQVYDSSATNQLWTSRYNGGNSDYFNTTVPTSTACLPTDMAVSPDGKYLATIGSDNHLTYCNLTNGIPDVSSIKMISPLRLGGTGSYGLGNSVAWDAADNLYSLSYLAYGLTTWTLGLSTAAVTEGTSLSPGSTYFNVTILSTQVAAYATNNPVISQANSYGNPTAGAFTLIRTGGNLSQPLTVNFTYSGTATNGTYNAGSSGTVIFAAGQTTTNILISAVTDTTPRRTIYLTLTLSASGQYSLVGSGQATMSILNTATPYMIPSVGASAMYNAFSNDYCSVVITRLGDTNTTETVNTFTYGGTATNGLGYSPATPVTFVPGTLTQTAYIYPLVGGQLPIHSATLPYTGNQTVTIGVSAGSGYTSAANTVGMTIVDSALPPETVLYADPFSDPAGGDAGNWNIVAANGDMGGYTIDANVQFGFDLASGVDFPIPYPPNGSEYALRMTVNKTGGQGENGGPMEAVNAYLTNQVFSGNFAIRFNMNVIESGSLTEIIDDPYTSQPNGTYNNEEGALFGFNHNGLETNWYAADEFTAGAPTTWAADGIFFWVSDSGGSYLNSFSPYEAFAGNGSPTTNTGWAIIGTQPTANFTTAFKTNVFTSFPSKLMASAYNSGWTEGGPGLAANGSANSPVGLSVASWSDVEIRQLNGVVTMMIDKTPIFVYNNTTIFQSGLLMLGYEDPYNGGEDADTAAYYSNLRVVAIGGPVITSFTANNVNHTFVIDFAVSDDDANSFVVSGSSTLNGTFANIPSATITSLGGGTYQAVVPQSGSTGFYRILQQ